MLSIAHTTISLPFGVYMSNPLLIFITAFIAHLLADTLLHWNIYSERFKRYPFHAVALDIFAGLGLAWFLVGSELWSFPILAAIAGGNAPDVLHGVWELLPARIKDRYLRRANPWFQFHDSIQLETTRVLPGLVWQLLLGTLSIAVLYRLVG